MFIETQGFSSPILEQDMTLHPQQCYTGWHEILAMASCLEFMVCIDLFFRLTQRGSNFSFMFKVE